MNGLTIRSTWRTPAGDYTVQAPQGRRTGYSLWDPYGAVLCEDIDTLSEAVSLMADVTQGRIP